MMKFKKMKEDLYIIRLERGEEVVEEVISFCKDLDIESAEIKGIGALGETELKHYNVEKQQYSSKNFNEEMEIGSLTGLVTSEGLHAHVVIANNKMQSFSGHLERGIVSATAEIILRKIPEKLSRIHDEETGLKVLDI